MAWPAPASAADAGAGYLPPVSAGELVDGCRVERLARVEDRGRELRLVGRVREVLGLEGVSSTLPVDVAADAYQRPVEEVTAVELNARLVGPDRQLASALRVPCVGGQPETVHGRAGLVQHPVVVVTLRDKKLRVVLVDPGADRVRRPEVERRARDRNGAVRDLSGVGGVVLIRVDLH